MSTAYAHKFSGEHDDPIRKIPDDKDAQRVTDTPKTDALIELDDSVLEQIGGGADPVARSRLWAI